MTQSEVLETREEPQLPRVALGAVIGNRSLAPKLDVRADAGYVVAPPSVHATGKRYRWATRLTNAPLPLPPKVEALLRQPERGTGAARFQPAELDPTGAVLERCPKCGTAAVVARRPGGVVRLEGPHDHRSGHALC